MIEKVMETMRNHGLYAVKLTSDMIGLTDNSGNVYDVVVVTNKGLIIDENTTMSLAAWLGY
jgi:hypothetical protein